MNDPRGKAFDSTGTPVPSRRGRTGALCRIGAVLIGNLLAAAATHAQGPDAEILSILADMVVQKHQFNPDRLHEMGLGGLSAVLDELLPDTAEPKKVDLARQALAKLIKELGDERFRVRESATQRLFQLGPGVKAAVREAARSSDAEVSWRATRILRKWETRKFEDKRWYAAAFAVYASGIHDEKRLEELARRVKLALDAGVPAGARAQILQQSVWAIARTGKDQYAAPLRPLLEHDDVKVAVLVTQAVGQGTASVPQSGYFPSLLLDALRSEREEVVAAALNYAPRCGDGPRKAEIKRLLTAIFEGGNEELKFQACYPLAQFHAHQQARDYLLKQLQSGDRSRQYRVLGWLGNSTNRGKPPDEKLLQVLLPLVKSDDNNLRRMASTVLATFSGEEVVKHLIPLLSDSYSIIARDVNRRLLEQPDKKMLRRLLTAAAGENPDPEVRKKAKLLLESLDPQS